MTKQFFQGVELGILGMRDLDQENQDQDRRIGKKNQGLVIGLSQRKKSIILKLNQKKGKLKNFSFGKGNLKFFVKINFDFFRSASSEKIDKEKLLAIARKNALKLIDAGIVPGAEKMTTIKAGGKTVNELTG